MIKNKVNINDNVLIMNSCIKEIYDLKLDPQTEENRPLTEENLKNY